MSSSIHVLGLQLQSAKAARCNAGASLQSSQSLIQDVSVSEPLLVEGMIRLQLDKGCLEDQCKLKAWHGGTLNLFDFESKTNRNLYVKIQEFGA